MSGPMFTRSQNADGCAFRDCNTDPTAAVTSQPMVDEEGVLLPASIKLTLGGGDVSLDLDEAKWVTLEMRPRGHLVGLYAFQSPEDLRALAQSCLRAAEILDRSATRAAEEAIARAKAPRA